MYSDKHIPPPILFNPLKHHLGFIKEYIADRTGKQIDKQSIVKDLKHLGGSLMDVYSGALPPKKIIQGIRSYLKAHNLNEREEFRSWSGKDPGDVKTIKLSDGSQWVLKYFENEIRYVHSFPSRYSPHSFRIKANTLKSAILYIMFVGKDYVTEEGLNLARAESGLSPVKDVFDSEAITEMIEILMA